MWVWGPPREPAKQGPGMERQAHLQHSSGKHRDLSSAEAPEAGAVGMGPRRGRLRQLRPISILGPSQLVIIHPPASCVLLLEIPACVSSSGGRDSWIIQPSVGWTADRTKQLPAQHCPVHQELNACSVV